MENAQIEILRKAFEAANKPIVLVGLMGVGKTTLGKALAELLECEFKDSDAEIVARQKMSVTDIFATQGEQKFRQLEREVIADLTQNHPHSVIATGGGAFIEGKTRAIIKNNSVSVFLSAAENILVERVGDGKGRPLLKGKDVATVIETLARERYPIYQNAHLKVEVRHEPEQETLNRLTNALYTHLAP